MRSNLAVVTHQLSTSTGTETRPVPLLLLASGGQQGPWQQPQPEQEKMTSSSSWLTDLLLVEVSSSSNVGAGGGGGGQTGGVVHDGVGAEVVVGGRVPALLLLLPGHRGHGPREPGAAPGEVGHTGDGGHEVDHHYNSSAVRLVTG